MVFAAVGSDEQRAVGTTSDCFRTPAPTWWWAGARPTTPPSTTTSVRWRQRLGDRVAAAAHYREAVRLHARLGAAGWLRLSDQALAALAGAEAARDDFRFVEGRWVLSYAGRRVSLPEAKGLQDLHTLLGSAGREVHVLELLGADVAGQLGRTGADPVLDERAKAQYRARLAALTEQAESAERAGDAPRAERVEAERSALVRELAAATGLGGRDRRLGDAGERARKTVGARIRDSLTKIDAVHPQLAAHLRGSLHLGTTCVYRPPSRRAGG